MADNSSNKADNNGKHVPEWVWEILLLVIVSPALAYAATSLPSLPIV